MALTEPGPDDEARPGGADGARAVAPDSTEPRDVGDPGHQATPGHQADGGARRDEPHGRGPDDGGEDDGGEDDGGAVGTVLEVVDELTTPAPTPAARALGGRVAGFDAAVDARFDRLRGRPPVDRLMYSVTELADFSLLWHLVGAARGLRSEADAVAALRVSVVLGIESTLVNGGLKSLFRRDRPVPEFERPHHLRIPLTTSFPSGHASAAMCAATLLADGRSRPGRAAWFGLGALVAASRVHVKIHHASDVLGGAAVGLVVGQVARRVWRLR